MKNIFEILNEINFFETKTKNGLVKPQAIFFDWENTIVQKKDSFLNFKENSIKHMFTQDSSFLSFDKYEIIEYEIIEKENIINLLDFIQKNNIFCGVISNKNSVKLNEEINFFCLKEYFQQIIGNGDCHSNKPMIDPLIYALSKTDIEFGKMIWFIGNSKIDMEFANITLSTGILYNQKKISKSNYFSPDFGTNNHFDKTKKTNESNSIEDEFKEDLEVRSMEEILDILKSMFDENLTSC